MKVHLVDGTYELFRGFYGPPPKKAPDGREVGATQGLLRSLLSLINNGDATHLGCAFDHVVESFRNALFEGYKTGEGIDPELVAQFPLAERAVEALGIVTWPMVEFEADDAIATAAAKLKKAKQVEQVIICSPDKDLAQLVEAARVVCWDRRREIIYDEVAVVEKYGVQPASIPDYLGLVGDTADGIPGIPGWGARSAAFLLAQFEHLEAFPDDVTQWGMTPGRARRLQQNLAERAEAAKLYRELATLRLDVPIQVNLDALEWRGARPEFRDFCQELGIESVLQQVKRWA
jgi:5'-3' exonuclease